MTKTKSTKRSLIMSLLSLLICVTMLIGTTYAWFTDSVTSAGNKIQAGTLKIDLELLEKKEDGSTKWTSLKDSKAPIFNYDKWEPGYTDVKILKVENEGTLALKWVAKFVSANDLTELANVIDVYVKPSADEFGYANDRTDLSTWTKKGTVAEFVNTISETTYGNLEAGKAAYLGIALKMQESADNKYQGMDLGGAFDIMILATQYTSESDSFNNQYDANAKYDVDIWDGKTVTAPVADADGVYHITSAADLVGMMNVTGNSIYKGKTIVLDNNIDLGGRTVKGIGGISTNFAGVFDGQGYTISNFKVDSTENSFYAGLFNQVSHGGTIKNLTVKNATIVGNSMVGAVASSLDNAVIDNCKAIDCTLIGVKKVGAVVGYSAGSTVTNNYAENCNVFYSEKEGAKILGYENTGSTVNNNTAKNVEVKNAVVVATADALSNSLKAGGNIVLLDDITMTADWTPVNVDKSTVLDGNGHTIFDMTIPQANADNEGSSALISCNTAALTVKNLNFDGASVTGGDAEDWSFAAVLVSRNWGELIVDNCKFTDCTVNGDSAHAALVCGYAYNANVTVTNCVIDKCDVTTAKGNASAMVGLTNGQDIILTGNTVTNSDFTGEKEAKSGILIGTVNGGSVVTETNNTVSGNTVYGAASDKLIGRSV